MTQKKQLLLKTYVLIVLITFSIFITSSAKFTFLFKEIVDKRFSNVTTAVARDTPIRCGRLCVQTTWCDVFNYHQTDHICELCPFYPGNDELVVTAKGWEMFYADDHCLSSPCLNSGTCTDTIGSYECTCVAHFEGSTCEIATSCIPEWTRFQNSCYFFVQTQYNVEDAMTSCSNYASMAHLVYVKSAEEQAFIVDMLQGTNSEFTWLGASLNNTDGKFYWMDGTPFDYSSWAVYEPTDIAAETNVFAMEFANFNWGDVSPTPLCPNLCEYELV